MTRHGTSAETMVMSERQATLSRLARLLQQQTWTFASTAPADNPHHYSLRRDWASDADFTWVVEQIRLHGRSEPYAGRPYTVLDIGGFTYWTMGAPMPLTILINRRKLRQTGVSEPMRSGK